MRNIYKGLIIISLFSFPFFASADYLDGTTYYNWEDADIHNGYHVINNYQTTTTVKWITISRVYDPVDSPAVVNGTIIVGCYNGTSSIFTPYVWNSSGGTYFTYSYPVNFTCAKGEAIEYQSIVLNDTTSSFAIGIWVTTSTQSMDIENNILYLLYYSLITLFILGIAWFGYRILR